MPIRVPQELPAIKILEEESIFVMDENRALHQDIRPLEILILNIMPKKSETETQILRLLSNTPIQLNVEFLQMSSHEAKNTSLEYLERFYKTFDEVKGKYYDGLIITGAPVERLAFDKVDYWPELVEVLEWSKTHVFSTIHICWGAQAGLFYHYGIQKYERTSKLTGVFEHSVLEPTHALFRGFNDTFDAPHSRYTEVRKEDVLAHDNLKVLSESPEADLLLVSHQNNRQFFIMGHCEYDRLTLAEEYQRDLEKGINPAIPQNYFPNDDPNQLPKLTWHSSASLLFANWLNYAVYQDTPYDLRDLEKLITTTFTED